MNKIRLSSLFKLYFTGCIACFALAGCASELPSIVNTFNAESPCCSSYSELAFETMPASEDFKFSVGPGDQVYLFPTGKSYLKAYRLPQFDSPVALEVRTFLVGQWIPTAHVFAPYVTVLDRSFKPLGDAVVPELFYDEGWVDGARWTGIVPLPTEAEFLVFHTSPELVNKKISLGSTSGYAYTTGTGTTYVPPSGQRSSSLGLSGNLRVKFLPAVK